MNEKSTRFFKLVRDFLTVYLPDQRAVSVNTIKSYRECLNQLLSYICDRNGFALGKLSFEYLSRETVESYLEYLEKERHCSGENGELPISGTLAACTCIKVGCQWFCWLNGSGMHKFHRH